MSQNVEENVMKKMIVLLFICLILISVYADDEQGSIIKIAETGNITSQNANLKIADTIISVWQDYQGLHRQLFAQRIDENGNKLWSEQGIQLSITQASHSEQKIVQGDDQHAIIVWKSVSRNEDGSRSGYIKAQRIDLEGNLLWGDEGITVSNCFDLTENIIVVSDQQGGVFVQDKSVGYLKLIHISSNAEIIGETALTSITDRISKVDFYPDYGFFIYPTFQSTLIRASVSSEIIFTLPYSKVCFDNTDIYAILNYNSSLVVKKYDFNGELQYSQTFNHFIGSYNEFNFQKVLFYENSLYCFFKKSYQLKMIKIDLESQIMFENTMDNLSSGFDIVKTIIGEEEKLSILYVEKSYIETLDKEINNVKIQKFSLEDLSRINPVIQANTSPVWVNSVDGFYLNDRMIILWDLSDYSRFEYQVINSQGQIVHTERLPYFAKASNYISQHPITLQNNDTIVVFWYEDYENTRRYYFQIFQNQQAIMTPNHGEIVALSDFSQSYLSSAVDPQGNFYFTWLKKKGFVNEVWVQKISAIGDKLYGLYGKKILTTENDIAYDKHLINFENDNIFFYFNVINSGYLYEIYAQKISQDQVMWGNEGKHDLFEGTFESLEKTNLKGNYLLASYTASYGAVLAKMDDDGNVARLWYLYQDRPEDTYFDINFMQKDNLIIVFFDNRYQIIDTESEETDLQTYQIEAFQNVYPFSWDEEVILKGKNRDESTDPAVIRFHCSILKCSVNNNQLLIQDEPLYIGITNDFYLNSIIKYGDNVVHLIDGLNSFQFKTIDFNGNLLNDQIINTNSSFDHFLYRRHIYGDTAILLWSDNESNYLHYPMYSHSKLYLQFFDLSLPSGSDTSIFYDKTGLKQNYPNPFNPNTNISFYLENEGNVDISIFNIKGQKVRTLIKKFYQKGDHEIIWDGKNDDKNTVNSGIYFYRLQFNQRLLSTKKCLLVK